MAIFSCAPAATWNPESLLLLQMARTKFSVGCSSKNLCSISLRSDVALVKTGDNTGASSSPLFRVNWSVIDTRRHHMFHTSLAGVWEEEQSSRHLHSRLSIPPFKKCSTQLATLHLCNALPVRETEKNEEEADTPWEGAIIFKRSAVQAQVDYVTSLERLGLSILSSELSRALALSMGLLDELESETEELITPVQISIDASREGRDIQLDGIIRTAFGLVCNRCLAPVAERVFATFNLTLTTNPVSEPPQQTVGVVLGADTSNKYGFEGDEDDEGEAVLDLDLDDKLHFPLDAKEVDISKYLRDTIHLEIPSSSLCDPSCKGLCIDCGVNMNKTVCKCAGKKVKSTRQDVWGPLEQLKKQMEEQQGDGPPEDSQSS
ncbi:unnamed protein product [Sphagnum jensenii]|uniref:DUF177 domain-containing protein n=1 Tax=Sphagnum jensenii TaxID=128206 RepID=A0ABP1BXG6_9BRYO